MPKPQAKPGWAAKCKAKLKAKSKPSLKPKTKAKSKPSPKPKTRVKGKSSMSSAVMRKPAAAPLKKEGVPSVQSQQQLLEQARKRLADLPGTGAAIPLPPALPPADDEDLDGEKLSEMEQREARGGIESQDSERASAESDPGIRRCLLPIIRRRLPDGCQV